MGLISAVQTLLSAGPSDLQRQQARAAAEDKSLVDKIELARDMLRQRCAMGNSLQKEVDKCSRELAALRARCPNGALTRDSERQAKRLFSLLRASKKRLEFNDQYTDKLNEKILNYEELRDNMRLVASHHRLNAGGHEAPLSIDIDSLRDDVAIDEEIQLDLQRQTSQITQSLTSTSKPQSLSASDAAFDAEFKEMWSSVARAQPAAATPALPAPAAVQLSAASPSPVAVHLHSQATASAIRSRRNPAVSLV